MVATNCKYALACIFAAVIALSPPALAQLREDYYDTDCPTLMDIMRNAMDIVAENDPVNLPALLRLWSHDAMVSGADGSVLLSSRPGAKKPAEKAEKDAPPNLTLFGFEAVEFLKSAVELECPGTVSCADILAISAQLAVELTGGPVFQSLLGRKDSRTSHYNDGVDELPGETMNMTQLVKSFAAMGLTQRDLVVLSGAHTIGFAHCSGFMYRLYNYNSTTAADPTLDWTLADQLRRVCPKRNADPNRVQALDITTIENFDNGYYFNLQLAEGILESDQLLYEDPSTRSLVDIFADDKDAFFLAFVESMIKLGNNRVLTGEQGEIREVCDKVND
ncbi:peroxidase [Marchantia polymorpha subsp. ruderalis]|uniref:Peroxidase n=2 Tax=Marchantia polymorpha TaxID=3197 RepID=A0AAF6B2W8_MARPO|nr:hypothetical protein MARPO_0149s0005 [Marchantia polymorpha]BBN06352.1 hypothetical protein Mp_3g20400 [Marchantia polymorpha subsp. ruderalis]|eukprot:PTQ29007.1 hypothetical protein MARPO_0149s0005 [Marchantia polymorpha]